MSDNRKVAAELLSAAGRTVLKERPGVHGSAENSFQMIGDMWTIYLSHVFQIRGKVQINPVDVAQMMSMLKKARAIYGDVTNMDNFVDDIGYSALAGMLQLPDPADEEKNINEAMRKAAAEIGEMTSPPIGSSGNDQK